MIKEQIGFRPGRLRTGQILNLKQFIENGFETNKIIGVAFVDLSTTYNTINHNITLSKLYRMTKIYSFVTNL